jgi:hypothetical protein
MRKPLTAISIAAAMLTGSCVLSACGAQPSPATTQSLPTTRVAADPSVAPTPGSAGSAASTAPATQSTAAHPTPTRPTPSGSTPTPAAPSPTTPTAAPAGPMFATPQAAMSYLAAAFNARDMVALRHVTTPQSRKELFEMWPGQVHLRLGSCKKGADSAAYVCLFPHDPPKGMDPSAVPQAVFLVDPAARPGWYMTELLECG